MKARLTTLSLALSLAIMFCGCTSDKGAVDTPANQPPTITSDSMAEATGGVYFAYHAAYTDPDGRIDSLAFTGVPSWLTVAGDSVFGVPPDGLCDTGFTVIVYDGRAADSLKVTVTMIPCVLVYGDSRTDHVVHQALVDSMLPLKPAAVFHSGDLVADGTIPDQWATFNAITADLRAVADFYPALGNHENQSALFFSNFELPNNEQWYSVDCNKTHFIILNSCVAVDTASEQYQWLVSDLAVIPDSITFTVAVFHHPPYSTGSHTEDERGLRTTWVPLFEQYGVDVVFNGHDHDYERSYCGGIFYVVAGGGGAPLYDQTRQHPCSQLFLKTYHFCKLSMIGDKLIVKVYDQTRHLIDQFEVTATAPR